MAITDVTKYNAKVGRIQDGDKFYIKSGGQMDVASGGAIELESGATVTDGATVTQSAKRTVSSGGEIEFASGATLDLQTGASAFFASTSFAARTLELDQLSRRTTTLWGMGSASGTLLTPAYGNHIFSGATGLSLTNPSMPAASIGARIFLKGNYMSTDANMSIGCPSATAKVINLRGSDLSSFELSEAGYLEAYCSADATWQIIQANILEHASS